MTLRRRGRVAAAAAATLVGAVLAGCAPSPTAPPTGLPQGVIVELRQLRSDVADRTAQVRVVNGTDEAIGVVRVEFADDRFDGAAVRDRESTIAAGRTVDLRIQLPPSACDVADDASMAGRVTLTLAGGATWTAEIPDPLGFVAPLHGRECLAEHVDETAALAWTGFTAGADSGVLALGVAPAGGTRELVLDAVRETNLLQFPGAARTLPLDLVVDGSGAAVTVDVPLAPARCDPHAVMEDKRGTVFTVDVHLDGVAGTIELAADEELRGRLLAWVGAVCGFG